MVVERKCATNMWVPGSFCLPIGSIVFAMSKHNMNAGIPIAFRSYISTTNNGPDCTIWEALHATMAHPDLFKGIEVDDCSVRYSFVGGELGGSNPIAHVLAEVKQVYPDRHVSCILSVGAGHARTIHLPNLTLPQRIFRTEEVVAMKNLATDSEGVAEDMEARFETTPGIYFRFNVDQGMQEIGAGNWRCSPMWRATRILIYTRRT